MLENFDIVEATTDQANEIAHLVNSAYRGATSEVGWTTEAALLDGQRTDAESVREMISRPDETVLIAEDPDEDGKILGCVHLKLSQSICWLGMLTVNPHLQDQGLGKFLLNEAESFAKFSGCQFLKMKVISSRSELISWYKRRGFRMTNDSEPFPYGNSRFGIPKTNELKFSIMEKALS